MVLMIIKLGEYDDKYRVVSLAKTNSAKVDLLEKSLDTIMVINNRIFFFPENISFQLTDNSAALFNDSCEYDAFEISRLGNAYKYYDNSSLDNALLATNRCNSNCIMCPTAEAIRKEHEEYTGTQLINLAKHIPPDAAHITITGGEPFLIKKDMFKLLDFLKNNLPAISYLLLTNGRAFCSKEYTELFNQVTPPNLELGIPLHGYNSATHDYIVQSSGAFNQTCAGLKNLLSVNAKIELRIVISKLNENFITEIAYLILNKFSNVSCVKFIGLEMTGNAAVNKERVWTDYPSAFNKSKQGIDLLIESGIDVGIYNFPLCAVDKKYWNICEKSISPYKIRYATCCDECIVRDACGGIFSGTIRLAKENLKPIR